MPFDLRFDELPAVETRSLLPAARRSTLRRAIGREGIERAEKLFAAVAAAERQNPHNTIRLNPVGLIADLKHDWLPAPLAELLGSITELANLDLSNGKFIGRRLRGSVQELVTQAEAVFELTQFLDLFAPSVIDTLVRPAAESGLQMSRALLAWLTSETDFDSVEAGSAFDAAAQELRDHRVVLCALPWSEELVPDDAQTVMADDEIEFLLGVPFPTDARRWVDIYRAFEAAGLDLCELGSRQLRYLGPYRTSEPFWSQNFLKLALRVGQSAFPLLVHRATYLAWQQFQRAIAADESAAIAAIRALFDEESLWMIDSQQSYFAAVDRYVAGEQAAIVEAYGDLAEGTLRRYGSLVVALARIAASQTVQSPLVFEFVSDVEAQLGVWREEPLPALILRFLERGLRNADAHANVLVDEFGALEIRAKDGTVRTLVPNMVYGLTTGLRAVLDGIDIAMNHASICEREKHLPELLSGPMPPLSATTLTQVVQRAAEEHTSGWVTDVRRDARELVVRYHGRPSHEELVKLANSLTRALGPNLPDVRIINESGDVIEILKPSRPRADIGRNDPCPCNSGKKYKKCHGA